MCIVLVNKSQNIVLSVKTTHKVGLLTRNIRIKASLGSTCREGKKVQHIHIFHSKNAYFYLYPYRVQCLQMLCFYKTSHLLIWHCADLWGIRAPSPWRAGRWPGEQLELFHNATYNYIGWEHTLTSNIYVILPLEPNKSLHTIRRVTQYIPRLMHYTQGPEKSYTFSWIWKWYRNYIGWFLQVVATQGFGSFKLSQVFAIHSKFNKGRTHERILSSGIVF